MSEADETKQTERRDETVEANVRHIEEAPEHLDGTIDEAREAVHRAMAADSMATPGVENAVSEADPAGDEQERQREAECDEDREDREAREDQRA